MSGSARPLIIGVNVNENTMRDTNPHIPWSPEEIAATAAECEAAGASVMHFHARTDDGRADHSAERYGQTIRSVRARSGLVLAPSLANLPGASVEERLSNIAPNQGRDETKVELLPIDMGCANMDLFDPDAREFATDELVFVNSTRAQEKLITWASEHEARPYLASFNLSWTRAILAHVAAGRLAEPVCMVLVLGGEEFVAAHPVTDGGVESHLALFPPGVHIEWMVSAYRGNVLEVAETVVARGGHVAIGAGDHHYAELDAPTTAELVRQVARIGLRHGRRPATTRQARAMLLGGAA